VAAYKLPRTRELAARANGCSLRAYEAIRATYADRFVLDGGNDLSVNSAANACQ